MTVSHKLDTTKRPGRIVSVESSRQGVPRGGGGGGGGGNWDRKTACSVNYLF